MPETTLTQIREFFEIPIAQFAKEWRALTDKDRADIKQGFNDGSMTY